MVGGKRATSAERQTIAIPESSVMESWKALLRLMCQILQTDINENNDLPLYQRVGIEVVIVDQEGLWSDKSKVLENWL